MDGGAAIVGVTIRSTAANVFRISLRSTSHWRRACTYDPATESGSARVRTSLAFYRGKVKVLETPIVERGRLDAVNRRAAVFQLELPAQSLKPGLYTCQVNIIDEVAGRFAFPRLDLYVR